MKTWLQITGITAVCVGIYVVMRALPVESCTFLHYGEFVNDQGVLEGCGYEETAFFHMDQIRYPILVDFVPLTEPEVGKTFSAKLTLFTTTGRPIRWEQIAVSHTERIHAMLIDPSLQDYHHLHPQPAGPDGHYVVEITPQLAGEYRLYLDFIPLINSRRTLLNTVFSVPGSPAAPQQNPTLEHIQGDLRFRFSPLQDRAITGRELRYRLTAESLSGSATRFSPVMDAYAHLVTFDARGSGFAHLHPQNPFVRGQDPLAPDLEFAFLFDEAGHYRVWAQVCINDVEYKVPFDLLLSN